MGIADFSNSRAAATDLQFGIWSPAETGFIPKIIEATALAFNSDHARWSEEYVRAKFIDGPWGPASTAIAIADDGTVAGFVSFGNCSLQVGDEQLKGGLSYHTFVHPAFQRRGIFSKLARLAVAHARGNGASILFNFPNPSSYPGFQKLGWTDIGTICSWIKPLDLPRILRVASASGAAASAFVPARASEESRDHLSRLASMEDALDPWRSNRRLKTVHTPQSLRWRLELHPYDYRLHASDGGLVVLRVGERRGLCEVQVLELFSAGNGRRLLCDAIDYAREEVGAQLLSMTASLFHPASVHLPLLGFVPMPNSVRFMALPLVPSTRSYATPKRWSISALDFHMY